MKHIRLNIASKLFKGKYPIKFQELRDLNHNIIPLHNAVIRCEIQYGFREKSNVSFAYYRKVNVIGSGTHSLLDTIIIIPMRKSCFANNTSFIGHHMIGATKLLKVNIKDGIRDYT